MIAGRRYDVVSDKEGGVTLEPAITMTVDEIRDEQGGRALTSEEFDELCHPSAGIRSVYERAHKRLHERYPDQ